MIKYATINPQTNEVLNAKMFDETKLSFETFKNNFELSNKPLQLVNITSSDFPSGQGWIQEFDGNGLTEFYPKDDNSKTLKYLKSNIIKNIEKIINLYKFNEHYVYKNNNYDKSKDSQLLYSIYLCMSDNSFIYPIEDFIQLNTGLPLTISNKEELYAFISPVLNCTMEYNREIKKTIMNINNIIKIFDIISINIEMESMNVKNKVDDKISSFYTLYNNRLLDAGSF